MLKKLNEIEQSLKLPPDHPVRRYVNMKVVFAFCLILILYTGLELYQAGFQSDHYVVSCPNNSRGGFCWNPFYLCSDYPKQNASIETMSIGGINLKLDNTQTDTPFECSETVSLLQCPDGICHNKTLVAGETHGTVPWSVKYQSEFGIGSFLVALILNHILFLIKQKKELLNVD
jgi:hypothetical protein